MIWVALAVYTGVTLWAFTLRTEAQFYAMAAVIALVQGGVQSLSRSLYARRIPAEPRMIHCSGGIGATVILTEEFTA